MKSDLTLSRRWFERDVRLVHGALEREFGRLPRGLGGWPIPLLALLIGFVVGLGTRRVRP